MIGGITDTGLLSLRESLTQYRPNSWVTLHLWDDHPLAHLDREAGICGPQIDNRAVLGEDMRVTLTNYYPELVFAHCVWWHDGVCWMSFAPNWMGPGDTFTIDLNEIVVTSA